MGKNKVRLSLFGTDYIITSDEEESYVRRIGDEVEKRITANMQQNTRISVLMSAVLPALDYCDEAKKANQSADNLRSQIKDYLEESAKARMEAGEARREIENMKREIQTLRMRLAEQDAPAGQAASQYSRPISPAVRWRHPPRFPARRLPRGIRYRRRRGCTASLCLWTRKRTRKF